MGIPASMPYTTVQPRPTSKALVPVRPYIVPTQHSVCDLKAKASTNQPPTGKRTTTAREILRREGEKNGWGRISANQIDLYTKDGITIHIGWTVSDPYQYSTGAGRQGEHGFTNRDHSSMCIISCRQWLRGQLIAP